MAMERFGKTYVIVTDDGPNWKDVFLTWTTDDGGYYTTVEHIDELGEYDVHSTVEDATARAEEANSETWCGWPVPMKIMEVLNFNNAYNDGEFPELVEVKTIAFK